MQRIPGRATAIGRPFAADDPAASDPSARFDPTVAQSARVYSFWLGGKDHFPADREVAREVMRLRPQVLAGARANRAFGRRVTSLVACGAGIRQFLDIGAGLPAPGSTHQTAHHASPACRVVYADNDPMVVAHIRAGLTSAPGAAPCSCIQADLRDPADLLAQASQVLDFTQPVAVLLLAVLHFLPDADDPAGIVAQIAAALAPGSLIAISHVTGDYAPRDIADSAAAYNARVPVSIYPRSREQVAALLGGLPLQYPGVVPVSCWQPSLRERAPQPVDIHAAVARLPRTATCSLAASGRAAPPAAAGPEPGDEPEPDVTAGEMARRAEQFPAWHLDREVTGLGIRYVARARVLGTRPHLVMTSDLVELCAQLAGAQPGHG